MGAVGPRACLVPALSADLADQELNETWRAKAAAQAQQAVAELLGQRASAGYKKMAVGGVMHQALATLRGEGATDRA